MNSKNIDLHQTWNVLSLQDFCIMWPGRNRQTRSADREERGWTLVSDLVGQHRQAVPATMLPLSHRSTWSPNLRYFSNVKSDSNDPGVQELLLPRVQGLTRTGWKD